MREALLIKSPELLDELQDFMIDKCGMCWVGRENNKGYKILSKSLFLYGSNVCPYVALVFHSADVFDVIHINQTTAHGLSNYKLFITGMKHLPIVMRENSKKEYRVRLSHFVTKETIKVTKVMLNYIVRECKDPLKNVDDRRETIYGAGPIDPHEPSISDSKRYGLPIWAQDDFPDVHYEAMKAIYQKPVFHAQINTKASKTIHTSPTSNGRVIKFKI